jgi:predicted DNA-binding transcriptional regulator YafY
VAHRVREAVWHRSQELTELPGGGVELAVTVAGIVEIQHWILSWGGAVEVLEPDDLRDAVAASVRQAADRYAG